MENQILIALFAKMLDEKLSSMSASRAGPRGHRGPVGQDGIGFVFSDHEERIKQWCHEFRFKFEDFTTEQIGLLRGPRGSDGRDGKDFDLKEHEGVFRDLAEKSALKFEDFTPEQIVQLRGPRGSDGRDGKDFDIAEHEGVFSDLAKKFALKFQDFTEDQINSLRGPRGRDGASGLDGHGFIFEENRNEIDAIIKSAIADARESLKLKFSDLSEDDIREMRGPRGRDGRDGHDFIFDDHREFFESLKLKFTDLSDTEKNSLKLQFSHLTEIEKSSLKLKFSDLTDEDRTLIRGPRGVRGQKGSQGKEGVNGAMGPRGPRGLPGPVGTRGIQGPQGRDGLNGLDGIHGLSAPRVTRIELDEWPNGEVVFIFVFDDGTEVKSDRVKLPAPVYVQAVYGGGGSVGERDMATMVDEVDDDTTYVGYADVGSLTSVAVWKIKRILEVGTETEITYAEGTWGFDKVWDNRASYDYA